MGRQFITFLGKRNGRQFYFATDRIPRADHVTVPVIFTYVPPNAGDPFEINVHWNCPSDTNVRFGSHNRITSTNNQGVTSQKITYDGPTPSTEPEIILTDDNNNQIFSFKYAFKTVNFKNDALGTSNSQEIYPFGGADAPTIGMKVTAIAIDPDNSSVVPNFTVFFFSEQNALQYFALDGSAIAPQTGGGTDYYVVTTDATGTAAVFVLPPGPGIYTAQAGVASNGVAASGLTVFLPEFAPSVGDGPLPSLEFPSAVDNVIQLDASNGPTFPVKAPSTILTSNGGSIEPTDSAVVATYLSTAKQATALVAGGVTTAIRLVDGVGISKSRTTTNQAFTSYYYMTSNGVSFAPSMVTSLTATGSTFAGPDPNVKRDHAELTASATVINQSTSLGGFPMSASGFTVFGLALNDTFTINVYLEGWDGNSSNPKTDFQTHDYTYAGTAPQNFVLPQEWFAGYGANGPNFSKAQFEFVGHPASGDDFYSKILTLTVDTVGA